MKYVYNVILSGILLIACSDKDNIDVITEGDINASFYAPHFSNGDAMSSRVTLIPSYYGTSFRWNSDDVVAVYSSARGMTNFFIDEKSISADSTSAIFNGSGFDLKHNEIYSAFYPYDKAYIDKTNIPVSYKGQNMLSDASFKDLGAFDYMWAKGCTDSNGVVNMDFEHLGCVVEYKIKVPTTAVYTSVRLIVSDTESNQRLIRSGKINLDDASPSMKMEEGTDTMYKVSLNNGNGIMYQKDTTMTVYMMMAPQDLSQYNLSVILVDKDSNWYSADVQGKNMKAGYTYHYIISDDQQGGGFTGNGIGFPNDEMSVELLSTYTHKTKKGYTDLLYDNNILYAAGNSGIRKIDYTNVYAPKLAAEYEINTTGMIGRAVAASGDYVYLGVRSNIGGSTAPAYPTVKFAFERHIDSYADVNEGNELSNNAKFNAFFRSLKIMSLDPSIINKTMVYKAHIVDGGYKNSILIAQAGGANVSFVGKVYATKEEALNALQDTYYNSKGDYCEVDWDAVTEGSHTWSNMKLNLNTLGDFDGIATYGNHLIINEYGSNCPDQGLYSCQITSESSMKETETAYIYKELQYLVANANVSLWINIQNQISSVSSLPVIETSDGKLLSLLLTPISNGVSIGINYDGQETTSSVDIDLKEWYQIKVVIDGEQAILYYRSKEGGAWEIATSTTLPSFAGVSKLIVGMTTSSPSAKIWIDNYCFDENELDDVNQVNGKLLVLKKSDLSFVNSYSLDLKVCKMFVYENLLFVNCLNGFNIYDVSTPEHPTLVNYYRPMEWTEYQGCEYYEYGNHKYVFLCNYAKGASIADITDLHNIKIYEIPFTSNFKPAGITISKTWDVEIDYPYAYVASAPNPDFMGTVNDKRGVIVYDLSNLSNITQELYSIPESDYYKLATNPDRQPTAIARYDNYLLLNNEELGFAIFRILDDGTVEYQETIPTPGASCTNALYVCKNGILFVGDGSSGTSEYPDYNVNAFQIIK